MDNLGTKIYLYVFPVENSQKFHSLYRLVKRTKQSEILGVFKEDTLEYIDFQKKLREIIENLTLEKALEIGISRREFYYLKKKFENKEPVKLKEKFLKKLVFMVD